jgi:hypothetical protein
MSESNGIEGLLSRVHRSADGTWHVYFQGRLVYDASGHMRKFAGEALATAYLERCKAAGRIVE